MKNLRLAVVGLALLAATLIIPRYVLGETYTYHGTGLNAYYYGYDYDPDTNAWAYFYASGGEESYHIPGGGPTDYSYGYIYYSSSQYFPETGIEEGRYAFGDVTNISLRGNLTSGVLNGLATEIVYTFDYNTYTYTEHFTTENVAVEVSLQGVGGIYKSKYSDTFKDPSHFNSRNSFSGSSRYAEGTPVVNGLAFPLMYSNGYLSKGRYFYKATYNP